MTNQPLPAEHPPIILIIPQSALDTMPAALVAGIRGCEAVYKNGTYYVTVPPDVYLKCRTAAPVEVPSPAFLRQRAEAEERAGVKLVKFFTS